MPSGSKGHSQPKWLSFMCPGQPRTGQVLLPVITCPFLRGPVTAVRDRLPVRGWTSREARRVGTLLTGRGNALSLPGEEPGLVLAPWSVAWSEEAAMATPGKGQSL